MKANKQTAVKVRKSRMERRFFWIGLLFVSPWLIGFLLFKVFPIISAIYYSFTDYNIFQPPQWVGFENYTTLFQDKLFWKSLGNTAYVTLIGLPLGLIVALSLAVLLHQKLRGLPFFPHIVLFAHGCAGGCQCDAVFVGAESRIWSAECGTSLSWN